MRAKAVSIDAELGPDDETVAAPPAYRDSIESIDAELAAEDETTLQPPVAARKGASNALGAPPRSRPPAAPRLGGADRPRIGIAASKPRFAEPATDRDARFGGEALAPSAPHHGLERASHGDNERTVQRALQPAGGADEDEERTVVRAEPARSRPVTPPNSDLTPTRALRRSSVPPPPQPPRSLPPPPRVPAPPYAVTEPPRLATSFAPAHAPPPSRPPRRTVPPPAPVPQLAHRSVPPPSGAPRSKMPTLAPMAGTIPPPPSFRRGTSRIAWGVAAGIVAIAAGAAFVLRPTQGELVVTAAGPRGEPAEAKVFVDGKLRCQSTPCRLSGLEAGTHLVKTESGKHTSAERAVVVESGAAASHHVTLDDPTPASGLRLAARGTGLRVFIDDRDVGSPPVVLDGLPAGEHEIRVVGDSDLYDAFEQRITIAAGETRDLGVVQLPVRRGRLSIEAGEYSEGAQVTVDGKVVGTVPTSVELDPTMEHDVLVSRPGFVDESYQVSFESGQAERQLNVELEPITASSERRSKPRSYRHRAPRPRPATKNSGAALLNLNSIPVTRVILDGQLLGSTPVLGRRVSPGTHTAVFIHPDGSRKVVSTSVGAGDRKTAAVRF